LLSTAVELSIVPGAVILILFDTLVGTWPWLPAHGSPAVILIHGSGVSQGQWVVARFLLFQAGIRNVHSINYFEGSWSAATSPKPGQDIHDLAQTAAARIRQVVLASGAGSLILVGHSLGGLIATHLHETRLCGTPIKHVFAISAPLEGSDLLAWAHEHGLHRVKCDLDNAIHRSMLRDSVFNNRLQEWFTRGSREERASRWAKYHLIAGELDPLVGPESATISSLRLAQVQESPGMEAYLEASGHTHTGITPPRTKVYPHLQHYNIAISAELWREDMPRWIREVLAEIAAEGGQDAVGARAGEETAAQTLSEAEAELVQLRAESPGALRGANG